MERNFFDYLMKNSIGTLCEYKRWHYKYSYVRVITCFHAAYWTVEGTWRKWIRQKIMKAVFYLLVREFSANRYPSLTWKITRWIINIMYINIWCILHTATDCREMKKHLLGQKLMKILHICTRYSENCWISRSHIW